MRRDLVYRPFGPGPEVTLGCGTIDHPPERLGRINYVFAESASAVLLLRGGGWYREGDGFSRRLAPGDLFLRLPGRLHQTIPDPDGQWVEFFIHMPRCAFETAVATGITAGVGVIWHPGLHADLLSRMGVLRERMRDQAGHSTCAVIGEMLVLLADLRSRHDAGAGLAQDPLAQAEALLREELDRPLPVRAVASRVGMAWEHFRKLFRQRTGLAPAAYRLRARMLHAEALLADPHLPLREVGRNVGYADAFAFSKAFRRWAGVAPSARRQP
jgi:AraC-like DNA-binding protein